MFTREFLCITTLGREIETYRKGNEKRISPDEEGLDILSDEDTTPGDACWRMIVNQTAKEKVIYQGNETACVVDIPPDVRARIIQILADKFQSSPVNCHVVFANDETTNSVNGYVMTAVLIFSLLCLLATVSVYALTGKVKTVPGLNLTCLCVAHFLHFLIGSLSLFNLPGVRVSPVMCSVFGFTRHFSVLGTFFWFNVMAFDIWKTTVQIRHSRAKVNWKKFVKYSAYAWGMSFAIAVAALVVDQVPGIPDKFKPMYRRSFLSDPDLRCTMSFNNSEGFFLFNIAPRVTILVINCIFFVLTSRAIYVTGKRADTMRTSQYVNIRFHLYLKLFVGMGLAWILNVIDYILNLHLGVDWNRDGPKWFNVVTSYVTIFIGIGIYLLFGLAPTIDLLKVYRAKNSRKKRLNSTSTTQCEPKSPTKTSSNVEISHIAVTDLRTLT